MTLAEQPAPSPGRRIDPSDPRFHLHQNLKLVQSGVKTRAAGIRKCKDCAQPYINDTSGLPFCRGCRTDHHRNCGQCGVKFRNTVDGDRLCECCASQESLF